MVEEQSAHRRALESMVARSKVRNETTGQIMAFIIALAFVCAGVFAIWLKEIAVGSAFMGVDFAALVGMFVYRQVREERRSKEGLPPMNID